MRQTAISILRGISIRMPLLIYGARGKKGDEIPITEDITLKKFVELVDDTSWEEFMPRGVTKENFADFEKYYDEDVFIAAGKRIRNLVLAADKLNVTERTRKISEIFSYFRNPDKETVLTPWRVVNMHMGDCLGGWSFFDKDYEKPIAENESPHFIEVENVTEKTLGNANAKILEINSKTGLYPLYCAYSIFRAKQSLHPQMAENALWQETITENIFVICKTPMAKAITQRTLCGFTNTKINAHAFDHLVNDLKNKSDSFIKYVTSENFWKKGNGKMEFDAIVGNPPYQEMDGGAQASANPIYNKFVIAAEKTKPNYVSMIMPSRWYAGGKGLNEFRDRMLNDICLQVLHDFLNPDELFPNTNIRGGLCYFLWNKNYDNSKDLTHVITHSGKQIISDSMRPMKIEGAEIFIRNVEAISIIKKFSEISRESFEKHVSSRKPFGLDTTFAKSSDFKSSKNGLKDAVECYGKGWKIGYLEKSLVKQNSVWIDDWKVFTARANNIGTELNDDNLVTKLGKPRLICTESYLLLGVGLNLNESSAKNLCKYFTTKFARFMHSLAKASQDATSKTYKFVPLQDFTSKSDIDWSQPIPEIDKQLYKKYGLSEEEIDFIEKMIRPME